MITSIVIFAFSCVGILALLLIKTHELKKGETRFFTMWRARVDFFVHDWFFSVKVLAIQSERKTIAFIRSIPGKILHLVSSLNEYLHERYGKQIDMIKGKGGDVPKGSASSFVNAISEYKKDLEQKDVPDDAIEKK